MPDGAEDSQPGEVLVEVISTADVSGPDHVSDHLMNPLHDRVCLWIAGCDELTLNSVLVFERRGYFLGEFSSAIHSDLGWPWISCKPRVFQYVGYVVRSFVGDFDNFEPAGGWVDHRHALKGDVCPLFGVAERVRTYQVDTQRVPRNQLWFLGREFPVLLMTGLQAATCVACLADALGHRA